MNPETVRAYSELADRGTRKGIRTQAAYDPGLAYRLGPTLLIGKYNRNMPTIYWATAPDGRRYWMLVGMYQIWLAVEARLKADRDLKVTDIARAAGVSRGYVSKVLRKLATFGFITILGSFRGRWGRVIAKLRNVSSISSIGGNIKRSVWQQNHDAKLAQRRQARYEDPWGSWRRAWERILAANELAEGPIGAATQATLV